MEWHMPFHFYAHGREEEICSKSCTRTYLSYLMMWELIIVHFCGKLVTVQSLNSYKKGYNKTWKI